jgi:hypothetical protein
MDSYNKAHNQFRTLNKIFDDTSDYHSSTFAHHDLSSDEDFNHFARGVDRLNYIKKHNIPILFMNILQEQYNIPDVIDLVKSITNNGFTNMKVLIIRIDEYTDTPVINYSGENCICYTIPFTIRGGIAESIDTDMIKSILNRHFTFNKLLSITDINI